MSTSSEVCTDSSISVIHVFLVVPWLSDVKVLIDDLENI
jgi:hypothetical protein